MSPRRKPSASRKKVEPRDALATELARLRSELRRRDAKLEGAIEEIRRAIGVTDSAPEDASARAKEDSGRRYDRLRKEVRVFIRKLPRRAAVAVASRGDEGFIDIRGRRVEHFPAATGGGYAGYYPPDGTAIIAHLETLRSGGIEYLVLPDTARWWLDKYPKLARHLEGHYERSHDEAGVAIAFRLKKRDRDAGTAMARLATAIDNVRRTGRGPVSILDWNAGLPLGESFPDTAVFSPPTTGETLPYLDGSVDVVVCGMSEERRLEEARRVAGCCVVHGTRSGGEPVLEAIHAADSDLPSASIIIPTWNGIAHLEPCIAALGETLPPDFSGEVIVVDDASATKTASALKALAKKTQWLRVIRNPRNYGFISSCNRGAKAASGEYLVFLNDDTVPQRDWLTALLRTFRDFPDAGAVGGRLVYPDGRLQEAGAVIFRDGTGANIGRGDYEVDAPLYGYVRPVSYCSGALLATPASLFREIGGFDRRYRPAYYEDTDYCFAVREAGHGVYYQPDCVVVHLEGATSGTDVERGVKRHQAVNRKRFARKWRHRLLHRPAPPAKYTRETWHALAALPEVA